MKISAVVDFLESVREKEGDLEVQSITGFWVRQVPVTGKRVIIPAVGDGQALDDILRKAQ